MSDMGLDFWVSWRRAVSIRYMECHLHHTIKGVARLMPVDAEKTTLLLWISRAVTARGNNNENKGLSRACEELPIGSILEAFDVLRITLCSSELASLELHDPDRA